MLNSCYFAWHDLTRYSSLPGLHLIISSSSQLSSTLRENVTRFASFLPSSSFLAAVTYKERKETEWKKESLSLSLSLSLSSLSHALKAAPLISRISQVRERERKVRWQSVDVMLSEQCLPIPRSLGHHALIFLSLSLSLSLSLQHLRQFSQERRKKEVTYHFRVWQDKSHPGIFLCPLFSSVQKKKGKNSFFFAFVVRWKWRWEKERNLGVLSEKKSWDANFWRRNKFHVMNYWFWKLAWNAHKAWSLHQTHV